MKALSEEVSHAQEKLSDCELTLAEKNRELAVVSEQLAAAREEGALLERKEGRPWLPHGRRGGGGGGGGGGGLCVCWCRSCPECDGIDSFFCR